MDESGGAVGGLQYLGSHSVEIVRAPAFRALMAQSSWAAAAPLHSDATCETPEMSKP